jgi:hypothetical protein
MSHAPFAHKGEHVTCPNGHVVEIFARDIYQGEILGADWFVDSKLKDGDEWGRCPQCGKFCCGGDIIDTIGPLILVRVCTRMHIEKRWRHII